MLMTKSTSAILLTTLVTNNFDIIKSLHYVYIYTQVWSVHLFSYIWLAKTIIMKSSLDIKSLYVTSKFLLITVFILI